jgi:hypothetical protein
MNPETRAYLRELASEFGESTNGIRLELNSLTKAKLLKSSNVGRTVVYRANKNHTLFTDLQSVVQKYVGIDHLVDDLISELGLIDTAYIIGDYARGSDTGLIDLVIVGQVKQDVLQRLVDKTGKIISREIRPLVLNQEELTRLWNQLDIEHALRIWGNKQKIKIEKYPVH